MDRGFAPPGVNLGFGSSSEIYPTFRILKVGGMQKKKKTKQKQNMKPKKENRIK